MYGKMILENKILPAIAAAAPPQFVDGTKNLLNDGLTWLLILIPVAGALVIGLTSLKGIMADDEQENKIPKKKVRAILGWLIFAEIASGVIKLVLSYY